MSCDPDKLLNSRAFEHFLFTSTFHLGLQLNFEVLVLVLVRFPLFHSIFFFSFLIFRLRLAMELSRKKIAGKSIAGWRSGCCICIFFLGSTLICACFAQDLTSTTLAKKNWVRKEWERSSSRERDSPSLGRRGGTLYQYACTGPLQVFELGCATLLSIACFAQDTIMLAKKFGVTGKKSEEIERDSPVGRRGASRVGGGVRTLVVVDIGSFPDFVIVSIIYYYDVQLWLNASMFRACIAVRPIRALKLWSWWTALSNQFWG